MEPLLVTLPVSLLCPQGTLEILLLVSKINSELTRPHSLSSEISVTHCSTECDQVLVMPGLESGSWVYKRSWRTREGWSAHTEQAPPLIWSQELGTSSKQAIFATIWTEKPIFIFPSNSLCFLLRQLNKILTKSPYTAQGWWDRSAENCVRCKISICKSISLYKCSPEIISSSLICSTLI